MIGPDEMSSASMDIPESFRPEDLSKTDFFDFVTAPDLGIHVDGGPSSAEINGTGNDLPLQGYDQFWGAEKDTSRLESAIFEDLNRYCWSQQSNSGSNQSQSLNTDGQIYTLTVLNGTEPWLRIDNTPDQSTSGGVVDFDTMLGNSFPGYIKSEYTYDESGFIVPLDNKDDIIVQQQMQQQQSTTAAVTNSISSTNMTFQNNNNDWQMVDHNSIEQETPESLLRSALQGKGYAKCLQLQNSIAIIPTKTEDDVRRTLFASDQDTLTYVDSSLAPPLFDETHIISESPNSIITTSNTNSSTTNVVVDDMFLTLDNAFTDDYEKIKRIASEVQQFCITTDSYSEVITEVAIQSAAAAAANSISEVTTTNPSPSLIKPLKKHKKNSNNNNNNNSINNNNNNISTNANLNNNNTNTSNNNHNGTSPTQCTNGQRKERSLHYCSICSKGFKDKYSVNVHIRTHTGEKPFACSLCGKSFRQKAHLAKHYQTHLAQKNAGATITKGSKQQQSQKKTTTQHQQCGSSLSITTDLVTSPTPPSTPLTNSQPLPSMRPAMALQLSSIAAQKSCIPTLNGSSNVTATASSTISR